MLQVEIKANQATLIQFFDVACLMGTYILAPREEEIELEIGLFDAALELFLPESNLYGYSPLWVPLTERAFNDAYIYSARP